MVNSMLCLRKVCAGEIVDVQKAFDRLDNLLCTHLVELTWCKDSSESTSFLLGPDIKG